MGTSGFAGEWLATGPGDSLGNNEVSDQDALGREDAVLEEQLATRLGGSERIAPFSLDHPEQLREIKFYDSPNKTDCKNLTMVFSVHIQGLQTRAVIDTASQVTVISEGVYQRLPAQPPVHEFVYLRGAAKTGRMKAKLIRGVELAIDGISYQSNVYVAPISDDCLLGLDFLKAHNCIIDMIRNTMSIDTQTIPIAIQQDLPEQSTSCRLVTSERIVLKPRSVTCTPCKIEQGPSGVSDSTLFIHSSNLSNTIFVPPTVTHCLYGAVVMLPVFNESEHFVRYGSGEPIAIAEPVMVLCAGQMIQQSKVRACAEADGPDLPEHLKTLFSSSRKSLSNEQAETLQDLLCEFQDIFSKDDKDIGLFTAIKHQIDTRDSHPIKQPMRRTPIGFEGEEEKHLTDMLDNNIIGLTLIFFTVFQSLINYCTCFLVADLNDHVRMFLHVTCTCCLIMADNRLSSSI